MDQQEQENHFYDDIKGNQQPQIRKIQISSQANSRILSHC